MLEAEIMLTSDVIIPPQALPEQEVLRRLRGILCRLQPTEREVFLLRQNGGLTYERIAEVVRRPVAVVKTQMRGALAALRRGLD
jgi:DNA-directed RNA polymerase specialized sigma24 family protein